MKDDAIAAVSDTVEAVVGIDDCLTEINNALNHWYPLSGDAGEEEQHARHVRLIRFRDRLAAQLKDKQRRRA